MELAKGRRWLRRHVRVAVEPGEQHVAVVTPGSTTPQVTISVRRHPDAGQVTVQSLE